MCRLYGTFLKQHTQPAQEASECISQQKQVASAIVYLTYHAHTHIQSTLKMNYMDVPSRRRAITELLLVAHEQIGKRLGGDHQRGRTKPTRGYPFTRIDSVRSL